MKTKEVQESMDFFANAIDWGSPNESPATKHGYRLVKEVRRLRRKLEKATAVRECPHCDRLI